MKRKKTEKEQKGGYSISEPTIQAEETKGINLENNGSRFVVILLSILAVIGILYLCAYLKDNKEPEKKEEQKNEIQYSEILVGTMLDQKYDEYAVYAYTKEDAENDMIDYLLTNVEHYYTIDLSKAKNSSVMADSSNFKIKDITEIKFKETTLLLIKKGKISKTYEGTEAIEAYLKTLA